MKRFDVVLAFAILCAVLPAAVDSAPSASYNSNPKKPSDFIVGGVDFRNFNYPVTPCNPKTAAMTAGSYTYNDEKEAFSIDLSIDAIAAGDMRGDGSLQAAVLMTCRFNVGFASDVLLFDVRAGKATFLAKVAQISDGEFSARYSFANGSLYVDQCLGDDTPSKSVVTTYRLRGKQLVKVNVLKHTSPKALECPYVN